MNHSLHLEMCFISESNELLYQQVESELNKWFDLSTQWFIHSKKEENLQIVTAEVHSKGAWESEDALLNYVEDHFQSDLLDQIYGYHVQAETKQEGGCCGCGKVG